MKNLSLIFFASCLLVACDSEIPDDTAATWLFPEPIAAADFPADIDMISLARLPQVLRENLDPFGQEAFDTYVSPGTGYETGLRGPIGMWMHSPAMAKAAFPLREHVRFGTAKDQRLTELTIIATAREINNQYEYSAHEGPARVAGLEEEVIDFVKFRKSFSDTAPIAGLGETESTIIQFTREVVSEERVSSATFAKAIEIFGVEGVTDLVGLIGYYNLVAITIKAFDVQQAPGSDLLLPLRAE